MFRLIGSILYVASPARQKAMRLLDLQHKGKIGNVYLAIITPIVVAFFLLGPLYFTLPLIFTTMTLRSTLGGIALTLLGVGGGIALKKAGYAIAHMEQTRQMEKFLRRGWILRIPQVCSDELLLQLGRLECLHYLSYYR